MIYLILFLIEIAILAYSDMKRWKALITPLNVMILPNTVAVIIAVIYSYSNKHVPNFYFPSLVVWMAGMGLFALPSIYFSSLCRRDNFNVRKGRWDDSYKFLCVIATICILISLYKLRSLSDTLDTYGTDEFSDEYQVSGIFAHLSVLLCAIFAYSVYKFDKHHLYTIFIIIGALIGMYAIGTKSWIIAPLLIGYYGRLLTGKTKFSVKTVILPVLLIFAIFFMSYFLILVMASTAELSPEFYEYLGEHFINYLSGANLAFSLDYQRGIVEPEMADALIAPFLNIINMFTKEPYVNVINPVHWHLGDMGDNNVRTVFGAFLCYSHSIVIFVMISLSYSILTHTIYLMSRYSKSLFMLLANCTCLTFLTYSFFDFTWVNLTPYELLVLFLLMHIILHGVKDKRIIATPIVGA